MLEPVTGWHGITVAAQICPTVPLPPAIPLTVHVTPVFELPNTCAVSVTRWFAASVAVAGDTVMPTPGCTAIVTCAFFVGSPKGVTVIVTLFGEGTIEGAVYVAELAEGLPPLACVVTTLNTPQLAPLHPGPDTAQDSARLGLEPGTGVRVAVIVAVPETGTVPGAATCSKKLLVIVSATGARLNGSATLSAMSVAVDGFGKIWGAM